MAEEVTNFDVISPLFGGLLKSAKLMLDKAEELCLPLPRPRSFCLLQQPLVMWPSVEESSKEKRFYCVRFNSKETVEIYRIPLKEYSYANHIRKAVIQPRKAVRMMRRLQAARNWCLDRTEGLIKQHQEILLQQAHWLRILEAEKVILTINKKK